MLAMAIKCQWKFTWHAPKANLLVFYLLGPPKLLIKQEATEISQALCKPHDRQVLLPYQTSFSKLEDHMTKQ